MKQSSGMNLPELDFIQDDLPTEWTRLDDATGWETVIFLLEDEEAVD